MQEPNDVIEWVQLSDGQMHELMQTCMHVSVHVCILCVGV